jgi:hypothetical protein
MEPDNSEIHVTSLGRATRATTPGTAWCMGNGAAGILCSVNICEATVDRIFTCAWTTHA